tara:strand:- start:4177 stop:4383 length:207 start_codon:yes stop_codon:yes gene_type:complete
MLNFNLEALMVTKEVASYLRVEPATVLRYVKEQKLRAIHLSKRTLRFPVSEVQQLKDSLDATYERQSA